MSAIAIALKPVAQAGVVLTLHLKLLHCPMCTPRLSISLALMMAKSASGNFGITWRLPTSSWQTVAL